MRVWGQLFGEPDPQKELSLGHLPHLPLKPLASRWQLHYSLGSSLPWVKALWPQQDLGRLQGDPLFCYHIHAK